MSPLDSWVLLHLASTPFVMLALRALERACASVAIAGLVFGASGCAEGSSTAPSIVLHDCQLTGLPTEARCGTLTVFEDRMARRGRTLPLHVAVVPALAAQPAPDPLFILVGGPGQAATVSGAPIVGVLHEVRKRRDIVLVDQRGTGRSGPLECPDPDDSLQGLFSDQIRLEDVERCLRGLEGDPRYYTTPLAMDDLDDVRQALGYERINLWGASYGTRAALVYLRRHRQHVRRVILDGPVPTDVKLPLHAGRDAQRALDLLLADCRAEPQCSKRFPQLAERLALLFRRLDAAQGQHPLRVLHPRTGKPVALRMSRDGFASALRLLLYSPLLSALVPLAIEEALDDNFAPFVAAVSAIADRAQEDLQDGMYLSIVCSEDVPRILPAEAAALTRGNFLGPSAVETIQQACAKWPAATLPERYFEPVIEDAPTLVLSGNLDPVVPPQWGDLVARRLPNARHIVVEGVGHGVTGTPCLPELIASFLNAEAPLKLDVPCSPAVRRPPFFTSLTGASP